MRTHVASSAPRSSSLRGNIGAHCLACFCAALSDFTPHSDLLPQAAEVPSPPTTETARLLLETDWERTPLGPIASWPTSLRVAVSVCLNSRFPMFVWWGPGLTKIYNDAYIPILGQRHPSAFGRPAREVWHEIWEVLGPQVEAVMQRGEATWNERVLLMMERNGFTEETYFTWSYSPIHDEQGKICGLFCACVEETSRVFVERERDRLVQEAQDAVRTLQTWFDNAPGFIALLRGPKFVFEMVNRAYYQLVGHRPLLGKSVFDALPDIRDQGFDQLLDQVYHERKPYIARGLRVVLQPEPGARTIERYVDVSYQPVFNAAGQVEGIFAQGHDVTEQVLAANALKQADQRKDEFLATLAHELRNPLAPVRQAAFLAKAPGVPQERKAWALDVIERQVSHMTLLIDDLLDVSRISRGKLELRLEEMSLRDVMAAAVETTRPLLDEKAHRLTVDYPDADVRLLVDPVRIAQVISNLLSNAAKYTDTGGEIVLSARVQDNEVVIAVKDNGIGLSATDLQEIFGMFSQVSSALDRAEGGLGIGLALTRGLAALHGGRVEARSAGRGQGSEFVVTLPWRRAASAHESAKEEPGMTSNNDQGCSILLADDNADALATMAMLLEIHGHQVHTAGDGEAAFAVAQEQQPQIAILDIGMPKANGYQVATRIREQAWGKKMKLIALTGWGQAQDLEKANQAGFDHHCTKPADVERLLELVAKCRAG